MPESVEHKIPDAAHDTGANKETGKVSHATGDSKVPKVGELVVQFHDTSLHLCATQFLQEGLPEKVEKAVPNAIHDTSGAKMSDGSVSK